MKSKKNKIIKNKKKKHGFRVFVIKKMEEYACKVKETN